MIYEQQSVERVGVLRTGNALFLTWIGGANVTQGGLEEAVNTQEVLSLAFLISSITSLVVPF